MASPDNILLRLSAEHEHHVRELYARLEAQGFPKQHQTPHITITFSPEMRADVVERAAQLLPHVIPASFQRVGTVVFGTKRKQTVAWLLETTDECEVAAREISAINPDGRGPRWVPHLTMGLRLPRETVPEYLRALDELTPSPLTELMANHALFWQPRLGKATMLAGNSLVDREGSAQ